MFDKSPSHRSYIECSSNVNQEYTFWHLIEAETRIAIKNALPS